MTELTAEERLRIFKRATHTFSCWYKDKIKNPLTDEELEALLKSGLRISGGTFPGDMSFWANGAGLRIWGSRGICMSEKGKPLFQGKQTIAMAREIYGIANPDVAQGSLF
jgi:hypothetical protein